METKAKERVRVIQGGYDLIEWVRQGHGTPEEAHSANYLSRFLKRPIRYSESLLRRDTPAAEGFLNQGIERGYLEIYYHKGRDLLEKASPPEIERYTPVDLDNLETTKKGEALMKDLSTGKILTRRQKMLAKAMYVWEEGLVPPEVIRALIAEEYLRDLTKEPILLEVDPNGRP